MSERLAKTPRRTADKKDPTRNVKAVRAMKATGSAAQAATISADKPLTDLQRRFVANWAKGDNLRAAAIRAGYGEDSLKLVYRMARMPNILAAYNTEKLLYQEAAQLSRKDVLDGMKEGIEMAKLLSDPQAVIAGWREVGKILGYYAPVQAQLTINHTGTIVLDRMNKMTDAELLKLVSDGLDDPSSIPRLENDSPDA